MERFDEIVNGALSIAQSEAIKRRNTELTPEHLLWGLVSNPSSFTSKALKNDIALIEKKLSELPTSKSELDLDTIRPSSLFSKWLTLATGKATESGKKVVGEKELVSLLSEIMPTLNIDYNKFKGTEEETEVPHFLVDLNQLAKDGKLDPVIGRAKEIRSVMEILGRRSKNNPVLVGPAGVGKTAIIEGLAGEILKGRVPDVLKDKTIYTLDLGQLMAGTKFRGEFEERIQHLLKFAKESHGNSIIFIDEIHQLVGAGKTDGAMDAANLLKPALARGEIHVIGATTFDEYQKYILGDQALDRRFRNVPVFEPSREDAIEILLGLREKFEIHHGIKISDEAIYSSVLLSDQYITDKNLPDKAIDLIDESASALKLSAEAMPAKLEDLKNEIRSKNILMQVEKNKELQTEIDNLQNKFDEGFKAWEKEVQNLKMVSELKSKRDRLQFDLENAERTQDYEEASRIKFSLMPEIEAQLETIEFDWVLDKKNIGATISRYTGIPLEKILSSKQDQVLKLNDYLKTKVFGQDEPLNEISETLLTSYAGLSDETKPLGSFLLTGPTGVGKTETVKSVTEFFFERSDNMIRIDMSEFSEKHSVAKLIGSPAGYVGYDDGGVLTEAVRRKPYSVILFDEIEKAHPDFSDILLQILDDGRLTDNKGRTINFKNTIIFMTTNSKNLSQDFKPEVLGRIDAKLEYKSLGNEVMESLIKRQVELLNSRLKAKNVTVTVDKDLTEILKTRGYSPDFGARPLQTVFNKLIIRDLSRKLVVGELDEGSYQLGFKSDGLTIKAA